MIEPIIMNRNFEKLAVIDDYSSFIWTTRYYKCGDFEIVLPVDSKYLEFIQRGFYIIRDDDEHIGIIQDFTLSRDEENKEKMIITGQFAATILSRRIIAVQTQLHGTVSAGISALITDNIISPIIPARKIPNFTILPTAFTERLEAQYTGKNLMTVIEDICEANHIGFDVSLTEKNEFQFKLFKGIDRSYNQSENPHVVFSDEYDNLLSSEYIESSSSLVTDVLVAGEGEGLDRKTLWVSRNNPTGLDRYELYQDQRNMSTNEGAISDDEYYAQMKEEGFENITTITTAFEGTVYFDNVEYRKDVYIGDIVVIENTKWNVFINSRLIEVIESVDESGKYEVIPTFGV